MATFPDDCLPPEGHFESRQALFDSINSWAKTRGYAFCTLRSSAAMNGTHRVFYACDRSRDPPRPSELRQRRTATRMTNCPFSILAKESTEGIWTLHHRPDSRFSVHNHEPSRHASAHPRHRQLSLDQLDGLNSGLRLDHFHPHWRLFGKDPPQLLLEPRQRIESRQVNAVSRTSTTRERSLFEVVEAQLGQPRRAPSRCTGCNGFGHSRSSRQCPLRYSDLQ